MSRGLLTLRRADAYVPVWVPALTPSDSDAASCIDYPLDRTRVRARRLLVFGVALAAVITIQLWVGAPAVEHGVYSDDAAHLMNGLLLRDYVWDGFGSSPMRFAEDYYLNYPKIAPLMWPPLFHIVLGMLLLAGGSPGATALLLVGLAAAWLVMRLYRIVERLTGTLAALATCALFLTTPLVMAMTSVVMLDIIVAAFALEAACWLARFVRSGSTRDAAMYGTLAALACLTKGTGVAVVLLPFLLIPITGRWRLLRRPGLYVAATIVVLGAGPLLSLSAMFDAGIGDFGPVTGALVADRARFYGTLILHNLGVILPLLAVAGVAMTMFRARRHPRQYLPLAESLLALAGAVIIFQLFNPHTTSTSRYLTTAIAPLLGLAAIGLAAITSLLRTNPRWRSMFPAIAAAVLIATVGTRAASPVIRPLGFRGLISHMAITGTLAGQRVLVVSDEAGEGAAVTEIATRRISPTPTVVRGSKLLADGDWMSSGLLTHQSVAAVMQEIEDLHIDYLVLDRSETAARLPYSSQVRDAVSTYPSRFTRIDPGTAVAGTRGLELYQVTTQTPGLPKPIRISLQHTLGRTLQR